MECGRLKERHESIQWETMKKEIVLLKCLATQALNSRTLPVAKCGRNLVTENPYTNGEGAAATTDIPVAQIEIGGNNNNHNFNIEDKEKKPLSTFSDDMERSVNQK